MPLAISDFVRFSIATPGQALPAYNTNVLGLLTKDVPIQNYGRGAAATAAISAGAVTALTPTAGGTGYLTPPPVFIVPALGDPGIGAVVTATVVGGAITGYTVVNGGTGYLTAPTVVVGNSFQIYNDPVAVGQDFGTTSETYQLAVEIFAQSPNILSGGGFLVIYAMSSGDTLSAALTATLGQIYCGGFIWGGYAPSAAEVEAAATLVQALNPPTMLFAPTTLLSDLYPTGMSYIISQAFETRTRLLIHTASALQARLLAAAYASRLMSTDFYASNTAITMNLKQLVGIPADTLIQDTGISETVAAQCRTVGVDFVGQVATLAEVVSTGGNDYSDNVYNLTWLLSALTVATFNNLATTPTKIPQTEAGMTTLKNAITQVLTTAVNNGFIAPGAWTATTFGDPVTLIRNVADFGYYVYSQPVAQQLQAQRQARQAPPIQIAIKYAGAVQSVNGLIYVNP